MPRYIPSIPFEDCYGSVGEKTYYHRNGVCYYKKRSRPAFPGTMLQMEHQTVHLRAIAAWQGLDPSVQKEWNSCAVGVQSHRPPFDGKSGISGYNLFVSAYHGFARLGREHTPSPTPREEFPVYVVDRVDKLASVNGTLRLGFHVLMPEDVEAGRYWLYSRIQLAKPGGGVRPGLMRNYLATAGCPAGESVVEIDVPNYAGAWDLDLQAYTLHCRINLLDSRTGYRNIYRMARYDFSL